jgi:hypothetical protein
MKSLAAHYTKYAKLGAKELLERDVCKEVLERLLGVVVEEKSITFKDGVLRVVAPSPMKMKLREVKLEVIRELKKKLGNCISDMV